MAFEPYEALRLVKETNFGVTKTSPVAGTDAIYIRLAGANRFTVRPVKRQIAIAHGGGFARRGYTVGGRWTVAGQLQVELCYSQAALLLGWPITRINAGRSTPWTTSGSTIGNLASMTAYHAIMQQDGTIVRKKYLGCVVTGWTLPISDDSEVALITLDLVAQKPVGNADDASSDPDATEFPMPADTAFPTDPVLFSHLAGAGGLTIGGSELSCVQSLNFRGVNTIDARPCAGSKFLSFADLRGRAVTLNANAVMTSTPAWRTLFNEQTLQTVECVLTNGANTITLDLFDANIVTGVQDDLQPGRVYDQSVTIESQYDTSDPGDIAVTVS